MGRCGGVGVPAVDLMRRGSACRLVLRGSEAGFFGGSIRSLGELRPEQALTIRITRGGSTLAEMLGSPPVWDLPCRRATKITVLAGPRLYPGDFVLRQARRLLDRSSATNARRAIVVSLRCPPPTAWLVVDRVTPASRDPIVQPVGCPFIKRSVGGRCLRQSFGRACHGREARWSVDIGSVDAGSRPEESKCPGCSWCLGRKQGFGSHSLIDAVTDRGRGTRAEFCIEGSGLAGGTGRSGRYDCRTAMGPWAAGAAGSSPRHESDVRSPARGLCTDVAARPSRPRGRWLSSGFVTTNLAFSGGWDTVGVPAEDACDL